MKAVWYEQKGEARQVLQLGELPQIQPGPGEVQIRVYASAVNPSDTKSRGGFRGAGQMPFPRIIPHQDGAGVIEAVGEGVSSDRIGERVWLYEAQWNRPFGTAAEFTVVPAEQAVLLPDTTRLEEGACLGIPAMTAHRCLFQDGSLQGQTVLVTGGTGAVGFYAVQLAKWGGARVITTVGTSQQAEIVKAVGADYVINRKTDDVLGRIREITGDGVDRVVDVAFGQNLPVTGPTLRPNGVIASYASDTVPEPALPFYPLSAKNATVHFVLVYVMPKQAHLAAAADITTCLKANGLKQPAIKWYSFDQVTQAHEAMETGHVDGKIVIKVRDEP